MVVTYVLAPRVLHPDIEVTRRLEPCLGICIVAAILGDERNLKDNFRLPMDIVYLTSGDQ